MEREEQEAWELAKQLVQIDSSDPGAYEEEIGLWITDWFKKQITDFGGKLADQIHVSRLEVKDTCYLIKAATEFFNSCIVAEGNGNYSLGE